MNLAARTVTGVIAAMVVATAAATLTGFWLSYDGLHSFALRSGTFYGAEAWAFPASVDLFIMVGEAGVTVSALRREKDRAAWLYLAVGFAASVCGNVLHVDPEHLSWTRYAVAAVPPVAAMLALAALLRQVYRLAEHAVPEARLDVLDSNGHDPLVLRFRGYLESGRTPGIRKIKKEMSVGQDRARDVRDHLRQVLGTR